MNKFVRPILGFPLQTVTSMDWNNQRVFKAKDICDLMDLQNPSEVMWTVGEGEKVILPTTIINIKRRRQVVRAWFVTELGLYQMLMQCSTDDTRRFRYRVASYILPHVSRLQHIIHA